MKFYRSNAMKRGTLDGFSVHGFYDLCFCKHEINMALIQIGFNRKSGLSGEEVIATYLNGQYIGLSLSRPK